MLITSITKEEMAKLPLRKFEGDIYIVDNNAKVKVAARYLSRAKLLGFDTETKPSFKKGSQNKVALLQLSTLKRTYLFRVNKIGLPSQIAKLLSNPNIIKSGVAIRDDIKALQKITCFQAKGFVELQTFAQEQGLENFSLKKLAAILLKFRVSKAQQLSNWETESLTDAQKDYAATDSWVSLLIYKALQKQAARNHTEKLQKTAQWLVTTTKGFSIDENLRFLTDNFKNKVVFTTSFGYEDQVITDFIFKNDIPIKVVTLDTGRLFEETYKTYQSTLDKYQKSIKTYFPPTDEVEKLLTEKGYFSFYESLENRKECCYIRKVIPLKRALLGNAIWITGLRADQSKNRSSMHEFEIDKSNNIIKFNPLIHWSLEQTKDYIEEHRVPYNVLHDKGFVSIGCAPCTRAIRSGEDFRAGRWWWENNSGKECGLHK